MEHDGTNARDRVEAGEVTDPNQWTPPDIFSSPVPGMETTEEEHKHWLHTADQDRGRPLDSWDTVRLLRDFDRLAAEVIRLTGELAEANERAKAADLVAVAAESSRLEAESNYLHAQGDATAREIAAREEERTRCLSIVRGQPYYPDTKIGMRQQWVKDQIETSIRSQS